MKKDSRPKPKPNNHGQIIYVVDDDVSVGRALKLLLQQHGFRVEVFTSAEGFLAFKYPKKPSCLLLDIRMPGGISGLVLQEVMVNRQLTIPIVFITSFGNIIMCVKAMQAGAIDFLPKPFSEKRLLNAIEIAIVKNKILNKQQAEKVKIEKHMNTLSPRELEVFRFVAQGMLNKQIASKRGTSIQTIKVHRSRVMCKMHAKTLTELIRFAQKAGITPSLN
jgi:FixJ family two-component response regulator